MLTSEISESSNLNNLIGAASHALGDIIEAEKCFRKAIELNPSNSESHNNLGALLQHQGKIEESVRFFKKALLINPNYPEAYHNLGTSLSKVGKIDKATENYEQALVLKPEYPEALFQIGNAQFQQGKFNEAIESFKKALVIWPDSAEIMNNMAVALRKQGKFGEAIHNYICAINIKDDFEEAYFNLADTLIGIQIHQENSDLERILLKILNKGTFVRVRYIAKAIISLIKLKPEINEASLWQIAPKPKLALKESLSKLSRIPLLNKFISTSLVPDLEIERLLISLRKSILSNITELKNEKEIIIFCNSLALHCFNNEYIYPITTEEEELLEGLEDIVKQSIYDLSQPTAVQIACLASYRILSEYDWVERLVFSTPSAELYSKQVIEPKEEIKLGIGIKRLSKVKDNISTKVKDQYEDNPYPRWYSAAVPFKVFQLSEIIHGFELKLFNSSVLNLKRLEILVAGCGTGQHSFETAVTHANSSILAVDLSLSSLSYAKRKTEEYGVKNIEYLQADILDLLKLNKRFDLIESVGVLHHMKDPLEGWKILADCLRSGGLMKIGLYSELARQDISEIRNKINDMALSWNISDIRTFRNKIINSNKPLEKEISSRGDFFSTSDLRDLLFHVQEHCFKIKEIATALKILGLEFCGFVFQNPNIKNKFIKMHGLDNIYNLSEWDTFEQNNPKTFSAMYQFWCQKK